MNISTLHGFKQIKTEREKQVKTHYLLYVTPDHYPFIVFFENEAAMELYMEREGITNDYPYLELEYGEIK